MFEFKTPESFGDIKDPMDRIVAKVDYIAEYFEYRKTQDEIETMTEEEYSYFLAHGSLDGDVERY